MTAGIYLALAAIIILTGVSATIESIPHTKESGRTVAFLVLLSLGLVFAGLLIDFFFFPVGP